jgi:threonine synthase
LEKLRGDFAAGRASDDETSFAINAVYQKYGELLDPHTAIGYVVGERARLSRETPLVVLATAHPAKFPAAVKAASTIDPALPPHMSDLFEKEERFDVLKNSAGVVAAYIDKICQ